MIISMIVAAGLNNEIGRNNDLPWSLPNDMKFFKDTTTGHCVLMGRNTWESFGGALKNRTNIVVTSKEGYNPADCVVVNTIENGIEYAQQQGEKELFILGGGEIFKQTLELTDRIYLTRIYGTFDDATVFFPHFDEKEWKVVHENKRLKDDRHAYDYTFFTYEREQPIG